MIHVLYLTWYVTPPHNLINVKLNMYFYPCMCMCTPCMNLQHGL